MTPYRSYLESVSQNVIIVENPTFRVKTEIEIKYKHKHTNNKVRSKSYVLRQHQKSYINSEKRKIMNTEKIPRFQSLSHTDDRIFN